MKKILTFIVISVVLIMVTGCEPPYNEAQCFRCGHYYPEYCNYCPKCGYQNPYRM